MMKKITRSCFSRGGTSLLSILWLLLLCLTSGSQGQRLKEPDGEQQAARVAVPEKNAICHRGGCYAVFLQKRAFRDAGRSCRERGGTLATMHNQEEAAVVHELLSGMEAKWPRFKLQLWIGLHRAQRQCSATRPLRGFIWVKGDQDGQFTNWLREESSGTCIAPRCVAVNVHSPESGVESSENFRWVDGSCGLPMDGFVCQFNFKGMCSPLADEGSGSPVYSTPFYHDSAVLTHVPLGSVAVIPCAEDGPNPSIAATEQKAKCIERDDQTVGWSMDAPFCSSAVAEQNQDWCGGDHGCEHFCQNIDSSYYCFCRDGFVLDQDEYSCIPDPMMETYPPQLSSDSASPTDQPHIKQICVDMGCDHDCMETPHGTRCTCDPGFQKGPDGRRCSDVDECLLQPCQQLCVNMPGTFNCICYPGYQLDDEGECIDIDECLDEGSCEGVCQNTVGSFACRCSPGFELNSEGECVDMDECAQDRVCTQKCVNLIGGYICECEDGFILQSDGITCLPLNYDGEYSTLSTEPSDSPDHDSLWSTALTPDYGFETETNFDVEWQTVEPDVAHVSDNHVNQWNDHLPADFQTSPSPANKDNTGNEIEQDVGRKNQDGDELRTKISSGSADEAGGAEAPKTIDSEHATTSPEFASETAVGKRKHDKSWLLVALLVPLCVFLVVMLALGIVYCTSCAVDKTFSLSDCYRWILPTSPPERRDGKSQA